MDAAKLLLQEAQQLRGEFSEHAKNILKRFETVNMSELPRNKLHEAVESIKYLRFVCMMRVPENTDALSAESELALLMRDRKN